MSDRFRQTPGIAPAIAAVLALALAGCGTSINSSSSPPSGTIQPQSKPTTGPVLGYVWNATSQNLRPVQGLPGAAILGAPTISAAGQSSSFISISSSAVSGMAVFLDAAGNVFTAPLAGGKMAQIAKVPGATALTLSNAGSYLLITGESAGASIASVISGLPQSPVARALDMSGQPAIMSAAVSDTGTVALAVSYAQSNTSVIAFPSQGAGAKIATPSSLGGMQFVPNTDELIVADGGTGALTAIAHTGTAPASTILSPPGVIASPIALDITPNGRWIVAANHAGNVLRIDLSGAFAATTLRCSCAPSQVQAMRGSSSGATVRLVTTEGPIWIVDAGGATPRVLFVPMPGVPTTVTTSAAIRPVV